MPDASAGWTVVVDRDRCIGSGVCTLGAPATFDQDDDARAIVLPPPNDSLDTIRAAVESCPTGALSLSSIDPRE
ncbi:MAG TPA: ferredoxin [Mycobacteriales bacterium]|nr:ferredoxin [Mycobacteriales bacterium]